MFLQFSALYSLIKPLIPLHQNSLTRMCISWSQCLPLTIIVDCKPSLSIVHIFSSHPAKPPGAFPHASPRPLWACLKPQALMFVCVCVFVSLLLGRIRPHERCSPGDTSGIPGMLLRSWGDFRDHFNCTTAPPLPPILRRRHTHWVVNLTCSLHWHEWALTELWQPVGGLQIN